MTQILKAIASLQPTQNPHFEDSPRFDAGFNKAKQVIADLVAKFSAEKEAEIQALKDELQSLKAQIPEDVQYAEKLNHHQRLLNILAILAPTHPKDIPHDQYPVRHPNCHGWYKGANLVRELQVEKGYHIDVDWHDGRNWHDADFFLPNEWFVVESISDLKGMVQEYCQMAWDLQE
jgi:hypothetical protein